VHGQVQERVFGVRVGLGHVAQGRVHVRQGGVVFGVFVNPLADQQLHGFERGARAGFGIDAAEKATHIGLGRLDQHASIVAHGHEGAARGVRIGPPRRLHAR